MKHWAVLFAVSSVVAVGCGDSAGPSANVTGTWDGPSSISCQTGVTLRLVTQRLVLTQSGTGVGGTRQVPTCAGTTGAPTPILGGQVMRLTGRDVVDLAIDANQTFRGEITASALVGTMYPRAIVGEPQGPDGHAYTLTRVP